MRGRMSILVNKMVFIGMGVGIWDKLSNFAIDFMRLLQTVSKSVL